MAEFTPEEVTAIVAQFDKQATKAEHTKAEHITFIEEEMIPNLPEQLKETAGLKLQSLLEIYKAN